MQKMVETPNHRLTFFRPAMPPFSLPSQGGHVPIFFLIIRPSMYFCIPYKVQQ